MKLFKQLDNKEDKITDTTYIVREIHIAHAEKPFVIVIYYNKEKIEFISSANNIYIDTYRTNESQAYLTHRITKETPTINRKYYDLYVPDNYSFTGLKYNSIDGIDAFGTTQKKTINVM